MLRAGRQIDVVRAKKDRELGIEFAVNNDDRYWGVEVDFDPDLDDEFSITTSKQQVALSDRMWQLLKENGVFAAIQEMRKRYDNFTAEIRTKNGEADPGQRPSEQAMADTDRFMPRPSPSGRHAANNSCNTKPSDGRGTPASSRRRHSPPLEAEASPRFLVTSEAMPESADFYEPQQLGGQTRVILNARHPFFTRVYNGTHSTPEVREALNLVLLTLAEAELETDGDRALFYKAERSEWSKRLMIGADRYDQIVGRTETPD